MRQLLEEAIKEKKNLEHLISQVEATLECVPEGNLRIARTVSGNQYYHQTPESEKKLKQGIYIKKENHELAYRLAQKGYDSRILENAKRRLANINRFITNYNKNDLEKCFEMLSSARKELVQPRVLNDEQYIRKWMSVEHTGRGFKEGTFEIYSNKGERVRSKSEKIIADMLKEMNIPYKYEAPLELLEWGLVYPDFTVLNVGRRKEMYWEHLGMMDNPEYCEMALRKLEQYQRNHLYLGKNLIITYETKKYPLETRSIKRTIEEYLLK